MGGKTSAASKAKYNKNAYSQFTLRIRKDTPLHGNIADFMTRPGASFNYLVTELLAGHFARLEDERVLLTQGDILLPSQAVQSSKQKGKGDSNSQGNE